MLAAETRTIADLVRESPLRADVFERYGIDYCCRGQRSLQDVCSERDLDLSTLLAELRSAPKAAGADVESMSLSKLCSHIVRCHHQYLRVALPSALTKMKRVEAAHATEHRFVSPIRRVFEVLTVEMTQHMAKEETILFPLIARLEEAQDSGVPSSPAHCGSVRNPIQVMEREHEDTGSALRKIRELSSDLELPAEACPTFRALYAQLEEIERDLHMHIHLENNILFPRASALA